MNITRTLPLFMLAALVFLASGCAAMKQLEQENTELKQKVGELEQLSQDYSDKLRQVEQMSAQDKAKMREEMDRMRTDLNNKLQLQVLENEAMVKKMKDLNVIELGEAALFASGQADLTRKGSTVIDEIAGVFDQYPGYHMRVEGHTDSKPISQNLKDRFASNWELSTARATSVVRYMIHGLKMDPQRISAAGFAHYRPVAGNDTRDDRAKNRRIRIVVYKELGEQSR